jgi:hypothetical protein
MQRNFAELEAADFEKAVHVVLWEIVVLQSNSRPGREANGGTCPSRFCAHVEQLGSSRLSCELQQAAFNDEGLG